MKDHRWLVSALMDMHAYAERCKLDDIARSLAATLETVSPIVGGVAGGLAAGARVGAMGASTGRQGRSSAQVITFPTAAQRRSA